MSREHQSNQQANTEFEVRNASEQMELLRKDVRSVARDVEEIKTAITGNTKLGILGFVKRMELNEGDIVSLKKWRDNITLKVAYTAGIVAGLTFGGLEGLKKLLSIVNHAP